MRIDRYAKAIVGALIAGLGTYQAARGGGIDGGEWAQIAITTLTALGVIWAVPNADAEVKTQVVNAEREYTDPDV